MLFGYPIQAIQENWLHECLCHMLETIHTCLDTGTTPPVWPDIIPAVHRGKLETRMSLKDRLKKYQQEAAKLTAADRALVISALHEQNDITNLLSRATDCVAVDCLPASVQYPIKCLFERGFDLLAELGIRDRQYKAIYTAMGFKLCPFCGDEYFSAPLTPAWKGAKREALDHYLAESLYPLAGANLRNLAPMGSKCNSKYKPAKNILYSDSGVRRRAFDPYQAPGLSISLDASTPSSEVDGHLISQWSVEFNGPSEEIETWDAVFAIRDRYKHDILNEHFNEWLREFQAWRQSDIAQIYGDDGVLNAIKRYSEFLTQCGLNGRTFLKAAVFRLLHKVCGEGNQRVFQVMRDLAGLTGAQE